MAQRLQQSVCCTVCAALEETERVGVRSCWIERGEARNGDRRIRAIFSRARNRERERESERAYKSSGREAANVNGMALLKRATELPLHFGGLTKSARAEPQKYYYSRFHR